MKKNKTKLKDLLLIEPDIFMDNRGYFFESDNKILSVILFCSVCFAQIEVTFRVDMQYQTVSSNGVHVAGSMQGWNPSSTALSDNDGDNIYVVKAAPVPVGSSLVVVGGDQKVVLEASDVLKVTSDTASSADVSLSILEIT